MSDPCDHKRREVKLRECVLAKGHTDGHVWREEESVLAILERAERAAVLRDMQAELDRSFMVDAGGYGGPGMEEIAAAVLEKLRADMEAKLRAPAPGGLHVTQPEGAEARRLAAEIQFGPTETFPAINLGAKRPQWEYLKVEEDLSLGSAQWAHLGREGWELVAVRRHQQGFEVGYFKRRLA